MDFRMRKSLAKVIKIRSDRAALPIAAYQDAIVKAVASNPCVLVAGDTGCGKSTQVSLATMKDLASYVWRGNNSGRKIAIPWM